MNIIERDWITLAGLRAVCLVVINQGRKMHRCGYIAVPIGHALFGKNYGDPIDAISQEEVDSQQIGKKSPILILTAAVRGDDGETRVRRAPEILFDVHGGLTYSGNGKGYPVESDGWWFGFDCAHCDDGEIEPHPTFPRDGVVARSEQYVIDECESLAAQIVAKFPLQEAA